MKRTGLSLADWAMAGLNPASGTAALTAALRARVNTLRRAMQWNRFMVKLLRC
jgi:hypothetical protein